MKGVGFSSKMKILLPLTEEYFGLEVTDAFKQLFSFYIKEEYELESPDKDDASQAIKNANKIIKIIKDTMQDIF